MPPSRILIFGGTFNPPHRAHAALPPLVAGQLDCQRILYIPAAINPLKTQEPVASVEHRLAMLRLSVAGVPHAEINTIELDRPGPSYAVETLEALRERFGPSTEFRLLIGSDHALMFHCWKQWQRIIELAPPAVMIRPPLDETTYRKGLLEVYSPQAAELWLSRTVPVPQMDICATEIRRRLTQGADLSDLLDPAVVEYIAQYGLYQE